MFYDNFVSLCAQKGVSKAKVAKSIGISGAAISKWKDGGMPNEITLLKLTDFFEVSVDDLMEKDKSPALKESAGDGFLNVSPEDMAYIKKYLNLGLRGKYKIQGMLDMLTIEDEQLHRSLAEDLAAEIKKKSEAAVNLQHPDFMKK